MDALPNEPLYASKRCSDLENACHIIHICIYSQSSVSSDELPFPHWYQSAAKKEVNLVMKFEVFS